MSKMMVHEKDFAAFSNSHIVQGESLLSGVYAGMDNISAIKAGIVSSLITSVTAGGAVGAGLANNWCMFFINEKRVVIAVLGYTSAEIQDEMVIERQNVLGINISSGIINYIVRIKLSDNTYLKFRINRFGVFGQPSHRQRWKQVAVFIKQWPQF